jgi:hypothetical protein
MPKAFKLESQIWSWVDSWLARYNASRYISFRLAPLPMVLMISCCKRPLSCNTGFLFFHYGGTLLSLTWAGAALLTMVLVCTHNIVEASGHANPQGSTYLEETVHSSREAVLSRVDLQVNRILEGLARWRPECTAREHSGRVTVPWSGMPPTPIGLSKLLNPSRGPHRYSSPTFIHSLY